MGRFINSPIAGLTPGQSEDIVTELEAKAIALVPCLKSVTDGEILKVIALILIRTVNEWLRTAGGVASQTTGPWSVSYVKTTIGAGDFPDSTVTWLRRISGCDATPSGLPRGSFPPPPNLTHLFEERKLRHG